MALSFPRDIPAGIPFYVTEFEPVTQGENSATQGGAALVVENGPSLWKASVATPPLKGSDARLLSAWLTSIKTPPQPFWLADLRRIWPANYQGGWGDLTVPGGGAFGGTCQLASVNSDGVTVGLSHLPVGFVLSPGDMLSWDYGSPRALHRAVSDPAVADGSGNITIEVRPVVRAGWTAGATVNLQGPKGKFLLIRDSDKPKTDNHNKTVFTFDAMQTLI